MTGTGSERWHGTAGGYTNHKCKCVECRKAWADWTRDRRKRRAAELAANPDFPVEHGTSSTYENWMCRCLDCSDAHKARRLGTPR